MKQIPRPSAGVNRIRFKGSVAVGLAPWQRLSSVSEHPSVDAIEHHGLVAVKPPHAVSAMLRSTPEGFAGITAWGRDRNGRSRSRLEESRHTGENGVGSKPYPSLPFHSYRGAPYSCRASNISKSDFHELAGILQR